MNIDLTPEEQRIIRLALANYSVDLKKDSADYDSFTIACDLYDRLMDMWREQIKDQAAASQAALTDLPDGED